MRIDVAVRGQLAARLKRLRQRATQTAAEIEAIERILADVDGQVAGLPVGIRKNGLGKRSAQANVRLLLEKSNGPVQALHMLNELRKLDPSLKSSTFRSHIRRMVAENIIERKGPRGFYCLVATPFDEPAEPYQPKRRRALLDFKD